MIELALVVSIYCWTGVLSIFCGTGTGTGALSFKIVQAAGKAAGKEIEHGTINAIERIFNRYLDND